MDPTDSMRVIKCSEAFSKEGGGLEDVVIRYHPTEKALSLIEYQFRVIHYSKHKFYAMFSNLRALFSSFRNGSDRFYACCQVF